jgi:hypothetical protein
MLCLHKQCPRSWNPKRERCALQPLPRPSGTSEGPLKAVLVHHAKSRIAGQEQQIAHCARK